VIQKQATQSCDMKMILLENASALKINTLELFSSRKFSQSSDFILSLSRLGGRKKNFAP
jgi:hypothetical protein